MKTIIALLTLCFTFTLSALEFLYAERTSEFQGDRHGEFKGNTLVRLTDGSSWKVHPLDTLKFAEWSSKDALHVQARTSWYWWKREHHFELYNHNRGESVRAMIISYPEKAPTVVDATTYLKDSQIYYSSYVDANGFVHSSPYQSNTYETKLALSDGTFWVLNKNLSKFTRRQRVYLGANIKEGGNLRYFLVTGTEREAVWSFVD